MTGRVDFTDALTAIVRGDPVDPVALGASDAETLCRQAVHHGVLPLVAERLARRDDVPKPLLTRLLKQHGEGVATDLERETELRTLLLELQRIGVPALVFKGAQLAYTHYARPDLRPRLDTDILIPQARRLEAREAMLALGYEPGGQISGDLVAYQASYSKRRRGALVHAVDLHWKIANSQVFADVLSFDELAARSIALPALSSAARGLGAVDSLLLACVHRVAHHYDSDHLIWLYDIDRIARRFSPSDWDAFIDSIVQRKVSRVSLRSLERAARAFRTPVPADLWTDGRLLAAKGEVTAEYLEPRRHASIILGDLRVLPTWTERARLLREHVFPSALYMRQVYAPSSHAPLAVLYARRLWLGGRKWLSPQTTWWADTPSDGPGG